MPPINRNENIYDYITLGNNKTSQAGILSYNDQNYFSTS